MKKILLLLLIGLPCCARAQNIEGQIVASQFGEFKVQSEGNGFAFDPASCNVSGGGKNIPAFATGTPIKIVDNNPALIEIAIPISASINGSYCTVSMPTQYTHTSFYLTSGTGGLQEAITNSKLLSGGPNTIILNAEWYELVSPANAATVIASVTGGASFGLVDVTTTPYSYYQWNGSQYVAVSAGSGSASFPASPGIVYNTNASSATNASSSQIASALNTSPSTQLAPGVLPIASSGSLGVVKPDGTTTSVSGSGVITANTPSGAPNLGVFTPNGSSGVSSLRAIVANDLPLATSSAPGAVKPDNSTITVTGGVISSLANLPAATAAGQVPTSTGAGTSYTAQTPGTLPSTSSSGLVPVSTGSGATYTPQQAPLSFAGQADQYIQQPLNNSSFTTLRVNSFNKVFYVDGFNNYGGIGAAPIAWSSGTNQPECQVVSYSGSYYIALSATNNTTTPGTSSYVWYPVPNNAAATNADCAFYVAVSYMKQNHQSALVQYGSGIYSTNQSFVNPVDGNGYDDEYSVSSKGCGDKCTYLQYTGPTAIPVFNRPTGGGNFTSMTISDMTIDGGGLASAAIELGSIGESYFNNISAGHVAPGSDHVIEFGHFGGDAFQVYPNHINIGVYPDTGAQNCGTFTANVVGGSITSYTVNNGGNCYNSNGYGGADLTVVSLRGYRGGAYTTPCATMPTGMTATIVGAAVTAISPGTGGSGCSGTIDVQVYQTPNVNYGMIFHNSDSTAKDIVSYDGSIAAFYMDGGNDTFIHLHPSVVPNGSVVAAGTGNFEGTEIDDVGGYGFEILEPFTGEGVSITGTNGYVGGNRFLNGSAMFYFGSATAATTPVTIGTTGSLCSATPVGAAPPDWQEFVTQSGTINSPADYIAKTPHGLSVIGNDTSCGQTMGDFSSTLTVDGGEFFGGTVNGTSIVNSQVPSGYSLVFDGSDNILASGDTFGNGGLLMLDTTTSEYFFNYISNPTSGYAKGPTFLYNQCLQFQPSGLAPDIFACRTAANTLSWGSTQNGTNATMLVNVPVSDLNGGSGANSGTYWRGDGSWSSPGVPTAYSGSVTYPAGAIAYDGSGNNYSSLAAGNVGNALTNTTYWHFLGGVSSTITGGNCVTSGNYMSGISTTGVPTCGQVQFSNLGGSATVAQLPTGTSGATVPLLNGANTYSGASTYSAAGAASTPGVTVSGAPYTGGSATTTFPQFYINSGAAVSTFSTSGTMFGVNAPSGFAGHLLNLFVNGSSTKFRVDASGDLFVAGTTTLASNLGLSSTNAPTMAAGAAAGTSPTCTSVTGNNNSMVISCTTGTATTASATLATITFNGALGTVPNGCNLTARNATTALVANDVYTTAPTSTTFTIGVATTALTASTLYSWSAMCF